MKYQRGKKENPTNYYFFLKKFKRVEKTIFKSKFGE